MTILGVLSTTFGLVGTFAYFPQLIKLYRRRSSSDVSITSYILWTMTGSVWLLYGFEIGSFPVVATNLLGTLCCLAVTVLAIKFKQH